MKTLVTDPFADDAISILEWAYGPQAKWRFVEKMAATERAGQAFMNVLHEFDPAEYAKLASSKADPFFNDRRLPAAIDKLTSK